MEKPKSLIEYTLIEQEFVTNALNELLDNHKSNSYKDFFRTRNEYLGYNETKKVNESKNIYFYVPELNKFFFVTTEHLLKDLEYRHPNEPVRERLLDYNRNEIFSIDDLADCRYGYYCNFSDKSIIYSEIIDKFKEKNPYSAIYEYEEQVERGRNNNFRNYRSRYYDDPNIELLGYAMIYIKNPQIEKMFKSGLERFVVDWIHNPSDLFPRNFKNGNNLNEITKLPKFAWQLLKDEGIYDINKWNEFRVWVQKDNLSKEQLETILNLNIRDTSTIKAIRSILNSEYDGKKLYTLDTLLNYLSRVDMYQAIRTEEAIIILRDYIKMSLECNVEPVTNSNSLKREHDVVMRNHQILLRAKREEYKASLGEPFIERSKELSRYEYENNELKVIVPKEMEDLLQEGRNNNNCVGGYIERFAKGTSNIFFIRKKDDLERSYITIEVNNDFSGVRQAYYSSNREITKESDLNFIQSWVSHIKEIYKSTILNEDKDLDITDAMF